MGVILLPGKSITPMELKIEFFRQEWTHSRYRNAIIPDFEIHPRPGLTPLHLDPAALWAHGHPLGPWMRPLRPWIPRGTEGHARILRHGLHLSECGILSAWKAETILCVGVGCDEL